MIPFARSRSFCSSMQLAARRISSSSPSWIPRYKRVLVERTDGLHRSRRCYVAPVPSESSREEKRQRRVSKQERREMLEAFVDRYRALNAGKFPTASHAKKHIGGCFYHVREIIQELEYKHKMSPPKAEKPAGWAKTDVIDETSGSPGIKDAVAVESYEVEVPGIPRDSEEVFIEESASHSTMEIVHSSEQTAESIEASGPSLPILSHDHIDKEASVKDLSSVLLKECGQDNVSDPLKCQATNIEGPQKHSPSGLAEEDAVAVNSFEVEVPHISRDSEEVFVEGSASNLTMEIIHSGEQNAESIEDSGRSRHILSQDYEDASEKDLPSSLAEEDAVAAESFEVEVPYMARDSEKIFSEESASHSRIEIIHSSEQTAERIDNSGLRRQILSHDYIDKEAPEKDFPSRLVNECGEDSVSDPIKSQMIDIQEPDKDSPSSLLEEDVKDDVHESTKFQADASVTLNLETEVSNIWTPVPDIQRTLEEKSSTICSEEEVELRNNEEATETDKLTGDNSTIAQEDASLPPKESSIWGGLRSLANGFINFWRKK